MVGQPEVVEDKGIDMSTSPLHADGEETVDAGRRAATVGVEDADGEERSSPSSPTAPCEEQVANELLCERLQSHQALALSFITPTPSTFLPPEPSLYPL